MGDSSDAIGPLIATTVRVMTWNIWWRFGPWQERAPAIASTLADVDADVIALQEVWGQEGGASFAATLAEGLGFDHTYAHGVAWDGLTFGNAILSRWPIVGREHRVLPSEAGTEEYRTVLRADVDGPRGAMSVFSTHLNWRFDQSHIRQLQVRAVADFVAASKARTFPPVLCGDFNAAPDSDEIRMLTGRAAVAAPKLVFIDAWEAAGAGTPWTWDNGNPFAAEGLEPNRRIDYVFAGWPKTAGAGHVVSCRLAGNGPVDGVWPSDHFGVVAELRY